jgi:predicted phosphodiesterase
MKIAVLADIHANYVALQTVVAHIDQWRPDLVIVAGDIVNRGTRPAECLTLVQQRVQMDGWRVVRGNHEDYVIAHSKPDAPRSGLPFEVFRSSYWTYCKLGCDTRALEAMPFSLALDCGVRVTHASMRHIRDGIYMTTPDDALREQIGLPAPGLFCVGHTHQPLIRALDKTLVVNVGAAGMPFDGDWHPSYAQLEYRSGHWHAEIIRLGYDRAAAVRDFELSGFLDEAGPLARVVRRELQIAQGQLHSWIHQYEKAVLAGEMTMEQSVNDFLART